MNEIVNQIEYEMKEFLEMFQSIEEIINPNRLDEEIGGLEKNLAEDPDVWNDPKKAGNLNKELTRLKQNRSQYEELVTSKEELLFSIELFHESEDTSLIEEIQNSYEGFQNLLKKANLKFLLNGDFDSRPAIVTIHPGAGGTESCDWASMLYRMYQRFAEQMGFKLKELDFQPGEVAGDQHFCGL